VRASAKFTPIPCEYRRDRVSGGLTFLVGTGRLFAAPLFPIVIFVTGVDELPTGRLQWEQHATAALAEPWLHGEIATGLGGVPLLPRHLDFGIGHAFLGKFDRDVIFAFQRTLWLVGHNTPSVSLGRQAVFGWMSMIMAYCLQCRTETPLRNSRRVCYSTAMKTLPRFQIGDRVRVIRTGPDQMIVGVVAEVDTHTLGAQTSRGPRYWIKVNGHPYGWLHEMDLAPAAERESRPA
jgi:hypothetical protein